MITRDLLICSLQIDAQKLWCEVATVNNKTDDHHRHCIFHIFFWHVTGKFENTSIQRMFKERKLGENEHGHPVQPWA